MYVLVWSFQLFTTSFHNQCACSDLVTNFECFTCLLYDPVLLEFSKRTHVSAKLDWCTYSIHERCEILALAMANPIGPKEHTHAVRSCSSSTPVTAATKQLSLDFSVELKTVSYFMGFSIQAA